MILFVALSLNEFNHTRYFRIDEHSRSLSRPLKDFLVVIISMPNRFDALKSNENPFKQRTLKKKRQNKNSDHMSNESMFMANNRHTKKKSYDLKVNKLDTEIKTNSFVERISLDDDAFPELTNTIKGDSIKKTSSKLCFGKTLNDKPPLSRKPSTNDQTHVIRPGVTLHSTEKTRLSLKITNLIIKRMEEQECKGHYLYWLNNWQRDREKRMENGETFYEPYSLDNLDDDDDSESDDHDMEETEYWNVGRGKQGISYDN